MYRRLLASTAILALATPAAAENITTAVTQPLRTSTVKSGSPDAITITSTGSVRPSGGTAVTMDSNHNITNQGTIAITGADGAIGILAIAGTTGDIVNSGTITIDETFNPVDSDNDGDLDGPFALGSSRFGIRTVGVHTGSLTHTGTITVEGNDSGGIVLGGLLNGSFTHDGATSVLGDRTVAVETGAVSGNVRLAGAVSARGAGATAARFAGDIGGALVVQGTISSSGYRATTAPGNTASLDADDLLQGGSALMIEGNVAGGVILAVAPKDNNPADKDEDKDGIEDAKEGNASVASYGAAPALVIGATDRAIAIGPVAGTSTGFGLIIDGAVGGSGVYSGVDGNGVLIGGRGGAVTIANGMSIAGTVNATSSNANATALHLGSGAVVPEVRVSGAVNATTGNSATAVATAVRVGAGASVQTLRNSGTIKATAGAAGTAAAIIDASGGLALVENSGMISASGAEAGSGRNIAIDLSANAGGATIRQTVVAAGITAPSITGDIRFGAGNDILDVADGSVVGAVQFGAGNNTMRLSGDAVYSGALTFGAGNDALSLVGTSRQGGTVDFGGGADTLAIGGTAVFAGRLANSGNLAVSVTGGTLAATGPVSIGSLDVGAGGTLHATLNKAAGEGTLYNIAGAATFASGASLSLTLGNVAEAEGRYTIVQAGSITGFSGVTAKTDLIPFMFKASLATDAPANTIAVDVARKSAQELGLNRSQASAYGAIFAAVGEDEDVEDVFLGINDGDLFRATLRQMLPDHAGGAFEGISLGSRTFARQLADAVNPVYSVGGIDVIFSTALWSSEKDEGVTSGYDLGGFGFSVAGEVDTGVGAFGLAANWFWNEFDQGTDLTNVQSDTYELAAYWRGNWGGFNAYARGSVGMVNFSGRRTFLGAAGSEPVKKTSESEWDGTLVTFASGVSYEARSGSFFFRPAVSLDYVQLKEDGYTDTGGGKALDLIVEDRKSDELAANGGLTIGFDALGRGGGNIMGTGRSNRWFRLETEGGWREIVGGSLGATTAAFKGGKSFTLDPEQNEGGWFARLRAMGGGELFELGGEAGAEERHGQTAFSLRGTMRLGF